MGKASRSKRERGRQEASEAKLAVREDALLAKSPSWSRASLFTASGWPDDFPRHAGLGILLLALLVVASYYPALTGAFIWDDSIFTSERPVMEWSGIWDIWLNPRSLAREGHYWPFVYASFWLEHKLWGFEPTGYHAVNLSLQLLNTLLVWRLMSRLAVPGAWLIAAVFAAHPLHVESVAWIIARKDLLSGAFYLGAALLWLRFLETRRGQPYLLAIGLFVASLLSKTVTVTLPAALLVLCWWKHGRIRWADAKPLLPFFAVGLAITVAGISLQASREPLDFDYSLIERAQIAAYALWFYLGKLLWPVDLIVIYPLWEVGIENLAAWGYVAAVVALAAALWLARGRIGRGPMAAAAFFLVTLSPVLGFIDYGYMQFSFVADRYQYLAGISVMALLVGAGAGWASRLPGSARKGVLGVALLGVVALAALSWKQSHIYRDEITFFSHILKRNPEARGARYNLARALEVVGRTDEAFSIARAEVERKPDFPHAYIGFGQMLLDRGELAEAEAVFREGWKLEPYNLDLAGHLASVIWLQGRHEESLGWYDEAIRLNPRHALAHVSKGDALLRLGRHEEAIDTLKRALDLGPPPLLHNLIGEAAQGLGRLEEAEEHYRLALLAEPKYPRANANLIALLIERQPPDEAGRHRQDIRESYADDIDGFRGLAEMSRDQERHEEALSWYDVILRIDPDDASSHAGKGDALFRLKRYEEALEFLERAVALDPDRPSTPQSRVIMGDAARALGRMAAAAESYELVLKNDPDHLGAIERLALTRYEQDDLKAALKLYRKFIALAPDQAATHGAISLVLYRLDRVDEALEATARALALDPENHMARTVRDLIREESR